MGNLEVIVSSSGAEDSVEFNDEDFDDGLKIRVRGAKISSYVLNGNSIVLKFADRPQNILDFGRAMGFEVYQNNVLLPLGKIRGLEYGLAVRDYVQEADEEREVGEGITDAVDVEAGEDGGDDEDDNKGLPMAYVKQGRTVTFGNRIACYAPELIIRSSEFKGRNYIIDAKVNSEDNDIYDKRALIIAAKMKQYNNFDAEFQQQACGAILDILPRNIGSELVQARFSELEEKLSEVSEANLPESEAIKENIRKEALVYLQIAQLYQIRLNYSALCLFAGCETEAGNFSNARKYASLVSNIILRDELLEKIPRPSIDDGARHAIRQPENKWRLIRYGLYSLPVLLTFHGARLAWESFFANSYASMIPSVALTLLSAYLFYTLRPS